MVCTLFEISFQTIDPRTQTWKADESKWMLGWTGLSGR